MIGAGALGLIAVKQFTEVGFDVAGFEARPYLGGLWKDNEDDTISVHATTIFNTSKFRAAVSDFPFPESTDVYPTAVQFWQYLNDYADHFDIRRKVRLGHRVRHIIRREKESDWEIRVKDAESGNETTHYFDRICVATGSFYEPRWPRLTGIQKFEGKVLHSIDFHGSKPFRDQNVLLIGFHATAQDVTNALSESARKVYLSHRHGLLMLPRFTADGRPYDTTMNLPVVMLQSWFQSNLPSVWTWLVDRMVRGMSAKAFPDTPDEWGLRPYQSLAVTTPLMADTIFPFLKLGFAEPISAVKEITGSRTVVLTDGRVLEDIDSIIYCTGYHVCTPQDLVPKPDPVASTANTLSYDPYPWGPGSSPYLYRNMIPLDPDPSVRESLAFMGHGAVPYPGLVQFDLQAMAISQIWRGWSPLPPHREMLDWHASYTARRKAKASRYGVDKDDCSTFYPVIMPFEELFPWLNETAGSGVFETFGGKLGGMFNLRAWRLWWQDRELWDLCTKKVLSPTVFRAIETGGRKALSREETVRILRSDNEILGRAVQSKRRELGLDEKGKKTI